MQEVAVMTGHLPRSCRGLKGRFATPLVLQKGCLTEHLDHLLEVTQCSTTVAGPHGPERGASGTYTDWYVGAD